MKTDAAVAAWLPCGLCELQIHLNYLFFIPQISALPLPVYEISDFLRTFLSPICLPVLSIVAVWSNRWHTDPWAHTAGHVRDIPIEWANTVGPQKVMLFCLSTKWKQQPNCSVCIHHRQIDSANHSDIHHWGTCWRNIVLNLQPWLQILAWLESHMLNCYNVS